MTRLDEQNPTAPHPAQPAIEPRLANTANALVADSIAAPGSPDASRASASPSMN
jgi:hypothetical protein